MSDIGKLQLLPSYHQLCNLH